MGYSIDWLPDGRLLTTGAKLERHERDGYAVARAYGETGITARLEPATIDGLVYASSRVMGSSCMTGWEESGRSHPARTALNLAQPG